MTKVQLSFPLARPLEERLLEGISNAHSVYGLHRVVLAPSLDQVTVEYDASRLTVKQVEAALRRSGIPVIKAMQ
jgi:hypothetical protein